MYCCLCGCLRNGRGAVGAVCSYSYGGVHCTLFTYCTSSLDNGIIHKASMQELFWFNSGLSDITSKKIERLCVKFHAVKLQLTQRGSLAHPFLPFTT